MRLTLPLLILAVLLLFTAGCTQNTTLSAGTGTPQAGNTR